MIDPAAGFIKLVQEAMRGQRTAQLAKSDQMLLGELIARLEAQPHSYAVRFDTGEYPGMLHSWRGSYEELALEHSPKPMEFLTVEELVKGLKDAMRPGRTFEGYKGGDFQMHRGTPVWVSHYGVNESRGVSGVRVEGDAVVIETKEYEF